MANLGDTDRDGAPDNVVDDATPLRRMLVAVDESPSAPGALAMVAEWVGGHETDVRLVQVREMRRHGPSGAETDGKARSLQPALQLVVSGPTLGARTRQLVHGIADAAREFGADVIVLGIDRPRLAGHRLSPSLRKQIMRATDLPVLVAPRPQSDGKRHHRLVPEFHRDEDRAHSERRYAHV